MMHPGGISQRLLELVHEPLTPATRAEFAGLVAELPPDQQPHWHALRAEADLLHKQTANVPALPEATLRNLLPPEKLPAGPPVKRPLPALRTRLYAYAAGIILIVGLVSWWCVNTNDQPVATPPLATATADKLAAAAVALHESNPTLDVVSTDPNAVASALKSWPMPFAPIMLQPRTKVELLGGGHTTLDGMPCLFTRWKSGATTCTLCQFDGRPQHLPPEFASTRTAPKSLWHDALHYQVIFWPGPGGACTWALVLENETTPDAFSNAY